MTVSNAQAPEDSNSNAARNAVDKTSTEGARVPSSALAGRQKPQADFQKVMSRSMGRLNLAGALVVGVLLIGGGVWAAVTEISGSIVASGELTSQTGRKSIEHFNGGVVASIHVRDGEVVPEGALLVKLDDVNLLAELETIEGELDLVLPRLARLKSETKGEVDLSIDTELKQRLKQRPSAKVALADEISLFHTRAHFLRQDDERLEQNAAMIRAQMEGSDAQISAFGDRIASLETEIEIQRQLKENGLTTLRAVTLLEREYLELLGDRSQLISEKNGLQREIQEIGIQRAQVRTEFLKETLERMNTLQAEVSGLRERRTSVRNNLMRTEIRAPESGIVLDMQPMSIGGAIRPGEPLMHIVPSGDSLIVTARIDLTARDKVWPTQVANLVFPGLDQRKFPPTEGELIRISADSLEDERNGNRFYEVEIQIPPDALVRIEQALDIKLVAGMPVEAFLTTQDRTVANHLLDPLFDNLRHVFRDS